MPQPVISGTPLTAKFGSLALPNGQGTMTQVNLNDGTNWQWVDFKADDDYVQLTPAQLVWRAKSVIVGRDRNARTLTMAMRYQEASTAASAALGAQIALLEQAGQQQLTFDNSTYVLANFAGLKNRVMLKRFSPFYWGFDLEFFCPEPYFRDISSTSVSAQTIVSAPTAAPSGSAISGGGLAVGTYTLGYAYVTASGTTAVSPASSNITTTSSNKQISVLAVTPLPAWATAVRWYFISGPTTGFSVQNSGGAFTLNTAGDGTAVPATTPATAFSVTYSGSVWAEPVWTLTIPNTNTAPIASFQLANTMSGESLLATFPGNLAASTSWTITIDTANSLVADQSGKGYDVVGSFPLLYPPAGQANAMAATLNAASGTPVGVTIAGSVTNRWLL